MRPLADGVFFTHVMKTGGKGLGRVIGSALPPSDRYPNVADRERAGAKNNPRTLLALTEGRTSRRTFYTVHMPAWVALDVSTTHLKITVLREPVARTVSHLRHIARFLDTVASLESLYAEDRWRSRLANYQTRLFAQSKEQWVAEAVPLFPDGDAPKGPAHERPARQAEFRQALEPFWATAIPRAAPLGSDALLVAKSRLETYDEVGITDKLGNFIARLSERLDTSFAPPERYNAASDDLRAGPALKAMIAHDCALDAALYEHARELSSA